MAERTAKNGKSCRLYRSYSVKGENSTEGNEGNEDRNFHSETLRYLRFLLFKDLKAPINRIRNNLSVLSVKPL